MNAQGSAGPAEPTPVRNSPAYWVRRFELDWAACGGNQQTRSFMELVVQLLPAPVGGTIAAEALEIIDWGCAEGDGVPVLAEAFPASTVVGVDVAEAAIARARVHYPDATFECWDLASSDRRTDVIVTSNVLEHFADPMPVLEDLAARAASYLVILVPFLEDPLIDEHEVSFDHSSFPLVLPDGKRLTHARTVDLRWRRGSPWPGLQLLAVYSGRDDASTLADLDPSGPRLRRRVRRQQAVERVLRPAYRILARLVGGPLVGRDSARQAGRPSRDPGKEPS